MSFATDLTCEMNATLTATPAPFTKPMVMGFEILSELGRGGMGIVFKAKQIALNRVVALKMVLGGGQLPEADRARFLAEAEAVAAVKHPNVVQVYEFGHSCGQPYFAMEFLDGGNLSRWLAQHGPLSPTSAAALLAQVARGVQAVHDVGVVHRDLKPANILLGFPPGAAPNADLKRDDVATKTDDAFSLVPKVTDFGIAKRAKSRDLTQTGIVMGTPAYMAPEQAIGNTKFVGPAADIYALGVILFETLAGRTPFVADDSQLLLLRVMQEDAPPLQQFVPAAPRDLALICEKCLTKAPHERYPSAAALAADLERFAAGEPVSVRPPGRLERAAKWVRKYPTRAAVYGLTVLAVTLGVITGGALSLARSSERSRQQAELARGEAERSREEAERAREEAEALRVKAQEAEANARTAEDRERRAKLETLHEKAVHDTDLAFREYELGSVAQARRYLDNAPAGYRPWEWRYVNLMSRRERAVIESGEQALFTVATDPATGATVTAGVKGVRDWANPQAPTNLTTGIALRMSMSRDGKRVAMIGDKSGSVVERPGGKPIRGFPAGEYIALSADGAQLLHGTNHGATLLDVDSGTSKPLACDELLAWCGAVSPDGQQFAIGGQRWSGPRNAGSVTNAGVVKLWPKGATGGSGTIAVAPDSPVRAVAFDPEGKRLVAGTQDGTVVICTFASQTIVRLLGHTSRVTEVAFDPSGRWVASASADRSVRVWDANTAASLHTFRGHALAVTGLAFDADRTRLASVGLDGTIRVWDLAAAPEAVKLAGLRALDLVSWVTITDDATRLIVANGNAPVQVFDTTTGAVVWPRPNSAAPTALTVRIDADGQNLTGFLQDGSFRCWDLSTGEVRPTRQPVPFTNSGGTSTDFKRVLVVDNTAWKVAVHDTETGKRAAVTGRHVAPMRRPVANADGTRVLTLGLDRKAIVWDTTAGSEDKKVCELTGHVAYLRAASFSPDGTRVATAGEDGWVRLWETSTGREMMMFRVGSPIFGLGWSPDGSKLVALDDRHVAHVFAAGPK